MPILNILPSIFKYLTYGYWKLDLDSTIVHTLLLEFTYPFSNFVNKSQLVSVFGFRCGIDYIYWPLLLIPSSLLKIIGISKADISTIGTLNTQAYSALLQSEAQGGIPTDFFTFSYYQAGILSLFIMIFILARILKYIDSRLISLKKNPGISIITLRICFLLISLANNFDFAVVFRTKYDLIILIYVVIYIYSKAKKERRKSD